jgi:hypothetical protein
MPVDLEKYKKFRDTQVEQLGSFKFDRNTLVWHYTNGPGLLGIIESGTLYSTQVSCLNDSSEMRYGQGLFKKALAEALSTLADDSHVKQFVARYIKQIEDVNALVVPTHAPSPFFVACFSGKEDDLSTWRAYGRGQNGYAIAFRAEHLFGKSNVLLKMNYDRTVHEKLATEVVAATLRFYDEGFPSRQGQDVPTWDREFVEAWESIITYLQPLIKDPGFEAESEYRILHAFNTSEDVERTVILQKDTMMTRHLPLSFQPGKGVLPIEKVMIGPCRHPLVTKISVDTLLRKKGYGTGRVVNSARPLQET